MSNWYPPPSRPRPVDDGIVARSKRGRIAQTWWSQRFLAVLEAIGLGNRMQRGRNYARRGQVVDLRVEAGMASAKVQGSRARPYRVRIGLTAFDKTEWIRLEQELAGSAWYAAKLLAGEMPDDIEEACEAVGLSLFPSHARELSLDCSCPDHAVPCKHIAATCYLLAEHFDTDPFAMLAWRGRERDDLLANLRALRTGGGPGADDEPGFGAPALAECLEDYFSMSGPLPDHTNPATTGNTLLDQLPDVDIQIRGHDLPSLLRPAYRAVGQPADPEEP